MMVPKEDIVRSEFVHDKVLLSVPATYESYNHFNHYAFSHVGQEITKRHEIQLFRGPGDMVVTDKHFLFFTHKPYSESISGSQVPFTKPYLMFHRDCLARVDFLGNLIRLDELICGNPVMGDFYGEFTFRIHQDFANLVSSLGLTYDPSIPVLDFGVPARPQVYYVTKYPPSKYICPSCRNLVQWIQQYGRYYCWVCRKYF